VITVDDYLVFVDDALDGMIEIVTALGDDLANRRPDIPETNSPYVLLTHCLGVMEFWGGYMIAGRSFTRDRDAEFRASGDVAGLVERAHVARRKFRDDLAQLDGSASARATLPPTTDGLPVRMTQGNVALHVYEELAQHRGQMEGVRDVLLAPWSKLV